MVRRGDRVRISRHCNPEEGQVGTTAILIISRPSDKNDYGELLFFSHGDVVATIHTSLYSLVSFPCSLWHQWQYPAVRTQVGLIFLEVVFGENGEWKPDYGPVNRRQPPFPFQEIKSDFNHPLPTLPSAPLFSLDLENHLWVVDGLFPNEVLDGLVKHFLGKKKKLLTVF
eukprot:sb/3472235/